MRREVLLVVAVVGLAGCSSGASKPAAAPTSVAGSATPPAATTPADGLTGFGATQAVWDAHHGAGGDYSAVTADNGRVDAYFLRFSARSTAEALKRVRQELPPDAVLSAPAVTTGLVDSKCLILTATSPTVGKVLGGPAGAQVGIELQSQSATDLNQAAIVQAALVTANKGNAPGC